MQWKNGLWEKLHALAPEFAEKDLPLGITLMMDF